MLTAEVIAVGSELLGSDRPETNSLFLAGRLQRLGIQLIGKQVVGDANPAIQRAVSTALRQADLVLVTGGLGPTADDLTREAVAELLERELQPHERLEEELRRRFDRYGMEVTENNLRQTLVPRGARLLWNSRGSAPGLAMREKGKWVFLLPGPPRELNPLVDEVVLPMLRDEFQLSPVAFRQIRIAGLPESAVDARAAPIYSQYPQIESTILSTAGSIELHLKWRGSESEGAESELTELTARLTDEFGSSVYSDRGESLAGVVGSLLARQKKTVATAESCTGGWLGKMFTDVAGSSRYFLGGVVAYSDALKVHLLGVNELVLEKHGAVSSHTAALMAVGVQRRTAADFGLSVTGIAGPEGGSKEKPVGLVYLGLADGTKLITSRLRLPGDRQAVRLRSCMLALDLLRKRISP